MRCLPILTRNDDEPYWVTREKFLQHFDQDDFLCRESIVVAPSYLADWFYIQPDGTLLFMLPTISFIAGKTQFINGRHRTAVLLQYLDEFPVAFALPDKVASVLSAKKAQDFLGRLALRPLDLHEFIELPDLCIVERLP
jgi:hypothetical protein